MSDHIGTSVIVPANVIVVTLSVSDMVDSGHRVTFDTDNSGKDISHVLHKASGAVMKFTRRKGVYD